MDLRLGRLKEIFQQSDSPAGGTSTPVAGHRAREHAREVERWDDRHHAPAWHRAAGWLKPHDTAICGRNPHGPGHIRSQADAGDAAGHRGRRSTRRDARAERWVARVDASWPAGGLTLG